MITFWSAIAVLIVIALAFMLYPLWRQRRQTGRWSYTALVAVLVTLPVAIGVYYQIRTYNPAVQAKRAKEMQLIHTLAARMEAYPDDARGWRLLGRSYISMGLYAHALDAYTQALHHSDKPNNALKLDYAEAKILTDRAALVGKAGKMVEQIAAAEPNNAKALWYSSQRALKMGQYDTARARLTRLAQLGVPAHIKQIIRTELSRLPVASTDASVPVGSKIGQ